MARKGRDFEEAVARFVATLDSSAEVLFDHRVPDCHTGTPRQVDVWINARFGGHFPLTILVSCKDHAEPLDIGDIGTFASERDATAAHMGVIYSRSGFYRPALEKAKALRIACCRLYQNQPSELPNAVMFDRYCTFSAPGLSIERSRGALRGIRIWNQLFEMPSPDGNGTILDLIQRAYEEQEVRCVENKPPDQHFPVGWETRIPFSKSGRLEFTLVIRVAWRRYRARVEAILPDGSYSYSTGSFRGSEIGPGIDTWDPPGPGWIELAESDAPPPPRSLVLIMYHTDLRPGLRRLLGNRRLP